LLAGVRGKAPQIETCTPNVSEFGPLDRNIVATRCCAVRCDRRPWRPRNRQYRRRAPKHSRRLYPTNRAETENAFSSWRSFIVGAYVGLETRRQSRPLVGAGRIARWTWLPSPAAPRTRGDRPMGGGHAPRRPNRCRGNACISVAARSPPLVLAPIFFDLALAVPRLWSRRLDSSHQHEDQDNDEDETDTTRRVIAPAGAVGPGGKSSDQQQDQMCPQPWL
jgi:hypothetical protein